MVDGERRQARLPVPRQRGERLVHRAIAVQVEVRDRLLRHHHALGDDLLRAREIAYGARACALCCGPLDVIAQNPAVEPGGRNRPDVDAQPLGLPAQGRGDACVCACNGGRCSSRCHGRCLGRSACCRRRSRRRRGRACRCRGDERIDLRVCHRPRRHHADQRTNRQLIALLGNDPDQHAGLGGLEAVHDLVGFDVDERVALGDALAWRHAPFRDGATLHLDAPLGDVDRKYLCHGYLVSPTALPCTCSVLKARRTFPGILDPNR